MSHHPSFKPDLDRHRFLAQLALLNKSPLDGLILQPRKASPIRQKPIVIPTSTPTDESTPLPQTADQDGVETFLVDGVIFPREGPFGRGCLKFVLRKQPNATQLQFSTAVYHPCVDSERRFHFPTRLLSQNLRDQLAYVKQALVDVDSIVGVLDLHIPPIVGTVFELVLAV
eukprot:m.59352 g.59352  ORF g.59352 m.59352 type:complete len:171 (-) comp13817_c0_seq2:1940-2452(-)